MKNKLVRVSKQFLVLCPIAIILVVMSQVFYISKFNQRVYNVKGGDSSQPTYMDMGARDDSTGTWLKRDYEWNGNTYDLIASTYDAVLHNNSTDIVDEWTLRIDITGDCFINNAWCGVVEIHQHVQTGEKVQTIDLRKYDIDKLKLDYEYDGDLLIPLSKGDYIIYFPSEEVHEIPMQGNTDLTIGMIFYYFDQTDFFTYELEHTYYRKLTYGSVFYLVAALVILWLFGAVVIVVSMQIYKDAERQLENKKSGLLCLSDIYFASYIVDLEKDTLIPVIEKNSTMLERPSHLGANAQIKNLIEFDADESYKDLTLEFCELGTLSERIGEKNSIASEYISKEFGWCSIRFFAMDRIEGRPLDRVLLTIQIIDSEKKEMDAIEDEIARAKNETFEQSAFLEAISDDILAPVRSIVEKNAQIIKEEDITKVHTYAKEISLSGDRLMYILYELVDYAKLETDRMDIRNKNFSVEKMFHDIVRMSKSILDSSEVSVEFDIADTVPKQVYGDLEKIRRIMFILTCIAADHTKAGKITLSVYGKQYPEKTHLIFSVRDTGDGRNEEDMKKVGFKLAGGLARIMGTSLNMVSTPENGSEAYFELEIIDNMR